MQNNIKLMRLIIRLQIVPDEICVQCRTQIPDIEIRPKS